MSSTKTRKTRSTISSDGSTIVNDLHANIHSSNQFINIYNQYNQIHTNRPILINTLCQLLTLENTEQKIVDFILETLTTNYENLTEIQFKQYLLPFIKQNFLLNNDLTQSTIKFLIILVEHRSNLLNSTLVEWLSSFLNYISTNISSLPPTSAEIIFQLFSKLIEKFLPLSKEILDILIRSSSIFSTKFLNQLKSSIKTSDDIHLALVSIHLWQYLILILSRLVIRGHTKGNEILAVIEDGFLNTNYSICSQTYLSWAFFIKHLFQYLNENDSQQFNNRLLKLFLTPFLTDSTSKSKIASISKCHAWIGLIHIYSKNIDDVLLPFLSFAFGNSLSSNTTSTTTAWWSECRQIGGEFLQKFLINHIHGEYKHKLVSDQILDYLFDSIVDQLLEYKINSNDKNNENDLWLKSWNAYLSNLMNVLKSNNNNNNTIDNEQRMRINTCLLTRMEQLWIDSRIETKFLLKLFETFEQINFPLAIETVLRDSNIRTKTLSAAQIHPSSTNHKSQDKSLHYRTTLSDQYLHMMLEHGIRFNDEDQTIEESYLHVLTYLIDTLSKSSDENFCYQTSLLLSKCSVELSHQPVIIPYLFWHIWSRCSVHVTNILNRSHTFELNNKIDNQKQETSIELLLRPFAFQDIERLDYSYTLTWIQLFKSLCRLTLINHEHLINLLIELLRNEPAFEQAINNQHNQRLFGLILSIIKILIKTYSDIDLTKILDRSNNVFSTIHKRSSPSLILQCITQFSILINHIIERLLLNNLQYNLVSNCLIKSTKNSSTDQSKIFVLTYIRDLIIDLLNLCKHYSHLEILMKNFKQLIPFLYYFEQSMTTINSSPISKQHVDNVMINKILTIILSIFEPSNSSALLQLIYPLLIIAFKHPKTIIRNKTRKCWNETFGRMTLVIYPNELRICLRELKDKEHLLLPCFLADHDNSNTGGGGGGGSGPIPGSTDESQLSQQIDIPTPLITKSKAASPVRLLTAVNRSINCDTKEPEFVPIESPNVNHKRLSLKNSCLTENQKEKLRKRHVMPLLYDENSNTQSNSYQQTNQNKEELTTNLLFSKPMISSPLKETEESMLKKLRRSSTKKSLEESASTTSMNNESIIKSQRKSILKRLSPTKSRQTPQRRVVFNDQVKVIVFPSPSRRDLLTQVRKGDGFKSPTRIIPKENLPLRKQPMSARRLSVMNITETIPPSPINANKTRSSKLFHPKDALADWTDNQLTVDSSLLTDPIFPSLINSDKSIDCLLKFLYDGLCPTDVLNYFQSNKLHTIGDIAKLTCNQIENLPISSPKFENIQKAFTSYQQHLSVLPTMDNTSISIIPIATTSDETIPMDTMKSSSISEDKLYDVEELIDSLDCDKTSSIKQTDMKRQITFVNTQEFNSPQKRCLSPPTEMDQSELSPTKLPVNVNLTLGDRLQNAADIYRTKGYLPFNDDYIELIRQLINNSSLTHLEKLHLKTLALND